MSASPDAAPLLAGLRRFLEPPKRARPGERCEFCAEPVPDGHGHVVSLETRALACACRACALLFTSERAAGGKYRTVPDRYLAVHGPVFSAAGWDSLQIPVSTAFFFVNSALGRAVAFYPSPAGATESLLPLEAWDQLARADPALGSLAPDVEALLVRRSADAFECHVVPIDACYELVGRIRRTWKGFHGGEEARREIDGFFESVRTRGRGRGGSAG
jgi:hypothetical protein